jgi:hypothetical protein
MHMPVYGSWRGERRYSPQRGSGDIRRPARGDDRGDFEQDARGYYSAQVYGRPRRERFQRASSGYAEWHEPSNFSDDRGHRPSYEHEPEGFVPGSDEVRPSFRGRGPKGFQRSDDRILEDVCELLSEHPDVDASEITVEVQDGEVTLAGTVADRYQKRAAEDVADEVFGVRDVHNRLRVAVQSSRENPSDFESRPGEQRQHH